MRYGILATLLMSAPAVAGEMNISQFVFRDLDRNGRYDLGEGPYAGLPVRLIQTGRDPVVRNANLSGFANFVMSDQDEGDILTPGPLEFVMEPPDGLEVTTGNLRQHSVAMALDGAPASLVIDPPLPFVGVAPILTIESGGPGVDAMTCSSGEATVEARIDAASGALVCAVSPGEWTVAWELENGGAVDRTVTVEHMPLRVPAPLAGEAVGVEVAIASFDDILSSENIQEVPGGHAGMLWHNFVAAHRKYYEGWGYINGTSSGQFSAYNSSGHPARMFADAPFDVLGMTVSVAWPDATRIPVRIEAIRDGAVVAMDEFFGSNLRPIRFDPGWNGIDEVRVSHGTYWQVVVDDITVRR